MELKKCKKCFAIHYLSYAIRDKSDIKQFYKNLNEALYFQYSKDSIFSVSLINNLLVDIEFKQASFVGFTNAYNYLYAKRVESRHFLNPKRLADVFYCYYLQKYYKEFRSTESLTCK